MLWSWRNDDETDSYIETPNVDNFGVSFIFERALRRLDVHAEQRKLQQDKFDSHLKKYENDIQVLELKLTNKGRDFDKLHDKFKILQVQTGYFNTWRRKFLPINNSWFFLQKQLVEIKTEKDILEMKLQREQENTHRMSRDAENMRWTKNELMDMIIHSQDINELRKKLASKRLF